MSFKIPDTPEELFRQQGKNYNELSKWFPFIIVAFLLSGTLLTSFYSIEPDEVGIIRRMGKFYQKTNPGLHWKIPFNIDQLNKVKVTKVYKLEFGIRTLKSGVKTQYSTKSYLDESLMLTGDLNVLDVRWIVQFKINDPVQFLFNIRNPEKTVRDVAESVMRMMVGDSSVNEVLTTRKSDINKNVQTKMQEILDLYKSGIQIRKVELQVVNPPDEVKPSFNAVNEAKQEKEKVINESWEAYNKVIPKARGEAEKTLREAEGYALSRINRAKGDAKKFSALWGAYKISKEVTRKRLYLETMEDVLPKTGKIYILDPEGNNVFPLLKLNEGDQK